MLNKVILIGNLGNDPEIKSMPNGNRLANFSLATSEYWKDKNGESQVKTEWHKIVVFNENLVKLVENYVKKGAKIYLEGSIKTRKYTDNAGIEKYSTEIVIQSYSDTIKILDSKKDNPSINEDKGNKDYISQNKKEESSSSDDEIPF